MELAKLSRGVGTIAGGEPGKNWWLGGRQSFSPPEYSEPAGGWVWQGSTAFQAAPFTYTNWAAGEPSDDDRAAEQC